MKTHVTRLSVAAPAIIFAIVFTAGTLSATPADAQTQDVSNGPPYQTRFDYIFEPVLYERRYLRARSS